MIDRFKWSVCCVFILLTQLVLSPNAMNAAAATKVRGATAAKSSPPKETSAQELSTQASDDRSQASLQVVIQAGRESVAPGESVSYDLTVANASKDLDADNVRLMDVLPAGFRFIKGSVRVNGITVSDPAISADGRALTFAVGRLAPGASSTLRFEAEVPAASPLKKTVNVASAFSSGSGTSKVAKAAVTVRGNPKPVTAPADIPQSAPVPASEVKDAAVIAPVAEAKTAAVKAAETVDQSLARSPLPSSRLALSKSPDMAGMPDVQVLSGVDGQKGLEASSPASLQVVIQAGREAVAPGESVGYDLTVANTSKVLDAPDVRLMDVLPTGFRFTKGSARLNGVSISDPAISTDGRALTFAVGRLAPGASSVIHFEAGIATASPPGKTVNVASAFSSGSGASKVAKATVTVRDNPKPINAPADTPLVPIPAVPLPSAEVKDVLETAPAADTKAIALKAEESVVQAAAPSSVPSAPPQSPKAPVADIQAVAAKSEEPVVPPAVPTSASNPQQAASKEPVAGEGVTAAQAVEASTQAVAQPPEVSSEPELPETSDEEETPAADPITADSVEQKKQSLSALIGMADISVLSDVDGQFVKNMAENQTLENEPASKVDETNLLESIRVGRSFNRESRAALARTEQANAQTGQAFALLLPSISVRANYGSETSEPSVAIDEATGKAISPDTHSRTDATLSVRQPLFDLPSFMDWQRRKVVEQARGENYKVSDGDAYISAVNAYLSIVSSRLQTDMTREFETKLNDLLTYVEKRAKAGAASNSDMARVRARSQATLSSRLEQESSHAAAGIEFIRLTNLVPRKVRLPELDDIGASLLPASLDMAVATAMKSNPEITALAAEIEAAEIDKKVAKGRYLPRVDAEYTYGYSLHAGGNTSSAGQKDQRIMMVLNWSLFSGGSDYKTHVERTARHKELQYRLDEQRRRVVQSLSANYATLATTRARIASGYQELKSISTATEAMSKRMLSGNQSLLDMLDVYDRLYQVRSRLVSLHILEMSTAAQLVRLMHGTPGGASGDSTGTHVKLQSK